MNNNGGVLNPGNQAQQQELSIENLQPPETVDKHNQRLRRDRQCTSIRSGTKSLSDREKRLRLNRKRRARLRSKNDHKDAFSHVESDETSTIDNGDKPIEINKPDSTDQITMSLSMPETHVHYNLENLLRQIKMYLCRKRACSSSSSSHDVIKEPKKLHTEKKRPPSNQKTLVNQNVSSALVRQKRLWRFRLNDWYVTNC